MLIAIVSSTQLIDIVTQMVPSKIIIVNERNTNNKRLRLYLNQNALPICMSVYVSGYKYYFPTGRAG